MGKIKINNTQISKLYLGNIAVRRAYSNGSIVYDTGGTPQPCFEVVDTISQASGDYIDVYASDTAKWYKKNNLNQYEEYGLMPKVSDLSGVTTYTGKLVILSSDSHEYKWNGSGWTDLGDAGVLKDYIFIDSAENSAQNVSYTFKYYFANDFKMKFLFYLTPNYSYSSDFQVLQCIQSNITGYYTSPLEFSFYKNGFYLDSHYPISGYNGSDYDPSDYSNRVMQQSVLNNHKGKWIIAEIRFNKVTLYNFETGEVIGTYGSNYTSSTWGTEMSAKYLRINSYLHLNYGSGKHPAHLCYIQVYDKNDNIVNDIRFVPDENQKIYMHDSIAGQDYTSPSTLSFNYHTETIVEYEPPVDYDEKVPPANNVHYNTLEELEIMECPWIGMIATVGQDYTVYEYTEDGWVLGDVPLDLPYLRFTALENTTFTFTKSNLAEADLEIKYSINGGVWKSMEFGVATSIVPAGSYVVFKSNFKGKKYTDIQANGKFSSTGNFNLSGNIMSLIHGDEFVGQTNLANYKCVFGSLFGGCTKLKSISSELLPATTLSTSCYYSLFSGCTGLTSIPANLLPATTLSDRCYKSMFSGCTGLTSIPANLLPATNMSTQCYTEMFQSSGVTSVPAGLLHATNLANSCYSHMFAYSNVNSIPADLLPATTLADMCYSGLFLQTKITSIPSGLLPSTNLAYSCYREMFSGCTNLKSANIELPATTVDKQWVYMSMFKNCTNLLEPPIIKATSVSGNNPFYYMFYGCSKMKYLVCDILNEPSSSISQDWLKGVAATGTFYKNPNATWDQTITPGTSTVPSGWTITEAPAQNYVKFIPVDDGGSTFQVNKAGFKYSIDGGAWTDLAVNTATPLVAKDHNIRFKGEIIPTGSSGIGTFSSSGKYNASGNIMNLLYGDYYIGYNSRFTAFTFQYLFQNSKIVDASTLEFPPVVTTYSYMGLFKGSSYMVTPPATLPFTDTGYYACRDMFMNCTAMTTVPTMTFARTDTGSHQSMFQGCTSLVDAENITITGDPVWDSMRTMFMGCSALQKSPIIKGSFGQNASRQAFSGCNNLTTITYLGTTAPNSSNTPSWLPSGCTATFYMNQNATWDSTVARDANGIPSGCTIVKIDPTSV